MRKVILYVAVSLDGFIARDNGAVDWLDDFQGDFGYKEFIASIDSVVLGYTTFVKSLELGGTNIFAGHRYYVYTNDHLNETHENISFVNTPPEEFVANLKGVNGKDIWLMGGGKLVQSFLQADCIDEMMLFVIPRILGNGIPLFPTPSKEIFPTLVDSKRFEEGITLLQYEIRNQE